MVEWWSECGANDGRGLGGWKRPDRETREKMADPQSGDKQLLWNPEPYPENPHCWKAEDGTGVVDVCKRRHNSKPLPSPGSVACRFCPFSGDKPAQAGAMQSSRGAGNVMDGHWKPNKTYRICCG